MFYSSGREPMAREPYMALLVSTYGSQINLVLKAIIARFQTLTAKLGRKIVNLSSGNIKTIVNLDNCYLLDLTIVM